MQFNLGEKNLKYILSEIETKDASMSTFKTAHVFSKTI